MTRADSLWGKQSITENPLTAIVGEVDIEAKIQNDELWILTDQDEEEWSRWALKSELTSINVFPVFPDKPVLVKPEAPFTLLPGARARIFVRVPVWVRITLPGKKEQLVTEIPSVDLFTTWFGSPTEGELCYWISTSARRQARIDSKSGHMVVCPLQLTNASDQELRVQKLCLRVKWLEIFSSDEHLWSNETKVSFKGSTELSQINVTPGPPKEASGAKLLSEAREHFRKASIIRTFLDL